MSGGHFEYRQYVIGEIADDVERLIGEGEYSPEVIARFKNGVDALRMASIYAQRIDWLVIGDDSEESFIRRLSEDLNPTPRPQAT